MLVSVQDCFLFNIWYTEILSWLPVCTSCVSLNWAVISLKYWGIKTKKKNPCIYLFLVLHDGYLFTSECFLFQKAQGYCSLFFNWWNFKRLWEIHKQLLILELLEVCCACLFLILVSTCIFNESNILCHTLGSYLFQGVNVLGQYEITFNSNCKHRIAHLSGNVRYIRP